MIRKNFADYAVKMNLFFHCSCSFLLLFLTAEKHLDKIPLSFTALCICCRVFPNCSCSHRNCRDCRTLIKLLCVCEVGGGVVDEFFHIL